MKRATLALLLLLPPLIARAYEVIELDVPRTARESVWSGELAKVLKGEESVAVPYGIADVVTPHTAIEVDRVPSWHAAIGQAIHYGYALKLPPCIALIHDGKVDQEKLRYIERICKRRRIQMIVLVSTEKLDP